MSGRAASAVCTRSRTRTVVASPTLATGTQATASVVPPTSSTAGSPSADAPRRTRSAARGSPRAGPRAPCPEVRGADVDDVADRARSAALLPHLAHHGLSRLLAVVDAAAGQRPRAGVRAARRVPGQQHLARRRAPGAAPGRTPRRAAAGTAGARRAPRSPGRPPARTPSSTPATGCQAASIVEPSTSTTCGSGLSTGDPAVVDDAQRVRVARRPCAPGVPAGGRSRRARSRRRATSRPVSSCTSRTTASRGSSPWSSPPPGRVHSSSLVSRLARRLSRMWSSRRMTAYAATRCTFRTCRAQPPLDPSFRPRASDARGACRPALRRSRLSGPLRRTAAGRRGPSSAGPPSARPGRRGRGPRR